MIPLGSHSGLTRPVEFVKEEWATYFDSGRVDAVAGAWRGILYANLAFIDPVSAWNFFSQPNFDMSLLDGGASLSWYLTLAATLGGVSGQQASGYNVSSAS
jgi:endo-1,3(4)-beta-glucanase